MSIPQVPSTATQQLDVSLMLARDALDSLDLIVTGRDTHPSIMEATDATRAMVRDLTKACAAALAADRAAFDAFILARDGRPSGMDWSR